MDETTQLAGFILWKSSRENKMNTSLLAVGSVGEVVHLVRPLSWVWARLLLWAPAAEAHCIELEMSALFGLLSHSYCNACFRTWHWQHRHRALLCHCGLSFARTFTFKTLGFLMD